MFTGIVGEVGSIAALRNTGGGVRLSVHAPASVGELSVHDSVSVNGVCLTVTEKSGDQFVVEAVEETLRKTNIGVLRTSSKVNLELAMKLGERLGGHLVLGHVDTVGEVKSVERKPSSWVVAVTFPRQFRRYVIPVGSIALDGISLTVAALEDDSFSVSIIPHTLEHTTLADVRPGIKVNLEFDILGKYFENFVRFGTGGGEGITLERLRAWGYGE
jgi:riboflavin synthase